MTTVTEIRLPQFGMGMQEGTIITWFKREGDQVAAGEVVAEIEAEKVTEELVATGSGVLQRILVPEGETVAVNELLAVITPAGAAEPDAGDQMDPAEDPLGTAVDSGPGSSPGQTLRRNDERDRGAGPPEPDPAEDPLGTAVDSGPGSSPGQALRRNDERDGGAGPVEPDGRGAASDSGPRRQVTPRARRLAADLGVDLDSVVGTGPGGRVTEDDVTAAAANVT